MLDAGLAKSSSANDTGDSNSGFASDQAPTKAPSPPPPLALSTSPPSQVSLLPFFIRGRRRLMLDSGVAKPTSVNDTGDDSSGDKKKDKGGGGGGGGDSSSKSKSSDRSVSSCSRVRGGRFRCSEGSNEASGPLGTMGG